MAFPLKATACFAVTLALASCSGSPPAAPSPTLRFPASSTLAGRCATPRTGIDPLTGSPYRDRQGTAGDEKAWVRSWIDELYLWYGEVPDLSASDYGSATSYFDALKTQALTVSGHAKDRFHFTYPSAEWEALSQSGVDVGYGVQWVVTSPTPPRTVIVAYNQPGSPAELQGVERGAQVVSVDGVDVVYGTDTATINAGLFPAAEGEAHTFVLQDVAGTTFSVTLTAGSITSAPVPVVEAIDPGDGRGLVGYIVFHDHVATAEAALVDAVASLGAAGITDLVLDLRYNGGGYLDIASELAFMIAGPAASTDRTFERTVFNDKYPTRDPMTGQLIAPLLFEATTQGFSRPAGQPLPSLGLDRVFVLTGHGTCSASESIINGLQGIDVGVIQIGATTCGKPYGFYPQDNCGTTYFAIQFQGVNDKGFGDYADGFAPGGDGGASPPGCTVADDFAHALGDRREGRLAAALAYRAYGTCPSPSASSGTLLMQSASDDGQVPKPPSLTNRILRR